MTIREIISKIENGSVHIFVYNINTGEVLFKTIWHNSIKEEWLNLNVVKIRVLDYELKLGVE